MVPVEPFDRAKGALSTATAKPQTPPAHILNSPVSTWSDAATGAIVQHPHPILHFSSFGSTPLLLYVYYYT